MTPDGLGTGTGTGTAPGSESASAAGTAPAVPAGAPGSEPVSAGAPPQPGCPFCEIVARRRPATILFEDEQVVAFRDLDPRAPTHVLVIPRLHLAHFGELRPEHGPLLAALAGAAQRVADAEGIAEGGYRVVANVGRDSGNSVAHLHLHVLGGRRLGWPPG